MASAEPHAEPVGGPIVFPPCSGNAPRHRASPEKKAVPAMDFISAERNLTEVCAFARPLAELVAPPTMRHHAETSSTMIADLRLPHPILAQQFECSCLRAWESQSCSSSSR